CDPNEKSLKKAGGLAPGAELSTSFADVLSDPGIDAVVLATPAVMHAEQARAALAAGKHVFVEKPMALNVGDAQALAAQAESAGRILMVGHLMLYHAA